MHSVLSAAWLIARKDLSIEFRTKSAFIGSLVFALVGIVIFYFAWDSTAVTSIDIAPGVLWGIFMFAGLTGLHRAFAIEHEERAMDALLAAPVDREAIFLGKAIANLALVVAVQVIAIPAVGLFYNVPLGRIAGALFGIAFLAAVGIVVVGTLFSAMVSNTRLAEILLPMLSLPFFVPILIPAAQATTRLLSGRPIGEALPWLKLLVAFDIVFLVACTLAFPFTIED
ncbi:MAG: heme exporter protein CcmB [Gemmatimonadaceae bacterium]|nr:heme exporter protein CcmB [Gemmatimonadaceae bacterium]